MLYDLAALGAAFSVALSNLISPVAIRRLGPVVFNCWRLAAALLMLVVLVAVRGAWLMPSGQELLALVASSVIGIVIGDSCVYAAMSRLGPRRTAVLYTTAAPFAASFGYLVLGELLSIAKIAGIALVVVGVSIAIAYRDARSSWEDIYGAPALGVLFGLLGGVCAAGAVLIARPVMAAGVDPALAAAIRAASGLAGLLLLSRLAAFRAGERISRPIAIRSAVSGLLGMGAGMTLVLFALSVRPAGIVTTLASTTPVLLLPLLWLVTGTRPAPQAWVGAATAIAGVAALSSGY